jgi:hypothetical protein
MTGTYRYVRHADIPDYELNGWRFVCNLSGHHGAWSVLMIYEGGGIGP